MYLFCFALLIILAKYLNYLRVTNATLRLQSNFTHLNSQLCLLAAEGKVMSNDPKFIFLHKSIEGSEKSLSQINFWVIVYIAFKTRKNDQKNYIEFEKEFENIELRKILNEYTKLSFKYFFNKNFFAICTFFGILKCIAYITKLLNRTRGAAFLQNFRRNFKLFLIAEEAHHPELCVNHTPSHLRSRNYPRLNSII